MYSNVSFRFLGLVVFFGIALQIIGCENPREIEVFQPRKGEIQESFTEPARTQLSQDYRITMPINGRVSRIHWQPGDSVKKDQELVQINRLVYEQAVIEAKAAIEEVEANVKLNEYNEIEKTMAIETQSTIKAFQEMIEASKAQVDAETARSRRAAEEQERIVSLYSQQKVSQSQKDDAVLLAETSLIELRRQEFYLAASKTMLTAVKLGPTYIQQWLGRKVLEREAMLKKIVQARARLVRAEYELSLAKILSPIDGIVLEKNNQGDGAISSGQPLLLLGNIKDLEVAVDVMTQDALKLFKDSVVHLETATMDKKLIGKVKKIEPAGFTKLSSLGVEQQRVKVIVKLEDIPENLGIGYRLQARFFTKSKQNAIIVPRYSVLQAPDQSYYVFKIQGDTLVRQEVKIGLRSDLELEITSGLTSQDRIAKTIEATMSSGEKIKILNLAPKN